MSAVDRFVPGTSGEGVLSFTDGCNKKIVDIDIGLTMANILIREELTENIVVIKINKLYRKNMTSEELYEVTRGIWKRRIESVERANYCLSVCKGIVIEVYSVKQWYPAGTVPMKTREIKPERCEGRIEFVGAVAPDEIRKKYIGKSVAGLYKKGEASPIKTFLKD